MQSDKQLIRVLGPWMATAIVVGTVIGSGVFKKPAPVAKQIPEFGLTMVAWVLVGLMVLAGAMVIAELAVLMPRAGGNYVYLKEAYGRMFGFLWGWVEFWIIRSASIAALAWMFVEALQDILLGFGIMPAGSVMPTAAKIAGTMLLIGSLAFVNARGTVLGARLQLAVTSGKVLLLAFIALLPYFFLGSTDAGPPKATTANWSPVWPADWSLVNWSAFGAALVAIIWPYHGWMNIAPVAEEVKDPGRNIPRALIFGVLILIALYCSVNVAYYMAIPITELKVLSGRTTAAEFCFRMLGSGGLLFASGLLMLSVFGSLNGNLLVGPRLLFAMGKDGLAPSALQRIHPRYGTPAVAEAVLAGWSAIIVVLATLLPTEGKDPFDVMTDFAMFGALSFETLAVASIFVFRRRFPPATHPLPYRAPCYPLLPAVYVLFWTVVLINMFWKTPNEAFTGLGFIAVGALVYGAFFARRGVKA